MKTYRVLVTGGSGFIGGHLVEALIESGMHVIALLRPGRCLPEQWHGIVTSVECMDWSESGLQAALASQGFDVAFHLAAYGINPTERDVGLMLRVNVDLPATVVRLCREHGARLVMCGTFSEYERPADATPLSERSPLERTKIYGASKAAGGIVACALAANLGVQMRYLRFFQVYGEGEAQHRLLPSLVTGLGQGRRVALSAGTQVRDFVYVKDAVAACIAASQDMVVPDRPLCVTWNICTGIGHSVRDFAGAVAQEMGVSSTLLGFGDLSMRADDEPYLVGDGESINRELGFRPQHGLAAGVSAALATLRTTQRPAM